MNGHGNIGMRRMNDISLILQRLIDLREIQAICLAAYGVLLLILVGLVGIFIAHSAYVVVGYRLLYRKKQPTEGWDKHFYPALIILVLFVAGVAWVFWQLSLGVTPFAI